MLALLLVVPTSTTAQSADQWDRMWALVPATLEGTCRKLTRAEQANPVPSVAQLICMQSVDSDIEDVGLFLFGNKKRLRDRWATKTGEIAARKGAPLGPGDCDSGVQGIEQIPGGKLICYRQGGDAKVRWIDEDNLLYGSLDTEKYGIRWAYDRWVRNIGSAPEPEVLDVQVARADEVDGRHGDLDHTDGPPITIDHSQANGVVSAWVEEGQDAYHAIVKVKNEKNFWVAVEAIHQDVGLVVRPAKLTDDLGAAYALAAVIPPGGEAAYGVTAVPEVGGSQIIRLHFDGQSIGGGAAAALNVVELVALAVGRGKVSIAGKKAQQGAEALIAASRIITDIPEWKTVIDKTSGGAPSFGDIPAYASVLLGTSAGRAAIIEALNELGVVVTDDQLGKLDLAARLCATVDSTIMAARKRQAAHDDPAKQDLRRIMERSRPLTDEGLVRELERWDREHQEGRLTREALWAVAIEVVDRLPAEAYSDPEAVADAVLLMLQNVAQGREPLDYGDLLSRTVFRYPSRPSHPLGLDRPGPLGDPPPVPAIPERTRRDHRRKFGTVGAIKPTLRRLERQNDIARLVEGGRSESAARRWLQRHPGSHWMDAPPPRRRRLSGGR